MVCKLAICPSPDLKHQSPYWLCRQHPCVGDILQALPAIHKRPALCVILMQWVGKQPPKAVSLTEQWLLYFFISNICQLKVALYSIWERNFVLMILTVYLQIGRHSFLEPWMPLDKKTHSIMNLTWWSYIGPAASREAVLFVHFTEDSILRKLYSVGLP